MSAKFDDALKSAPAQKFDSLLRQVLSVSKKEIDRRDAEYRKQRARIKREK
jgi:hypothetical protein